MDVVGVVGPRIRLIPQDKELHLENYVRWLNDPEVTRYLTINWPLTRLAEEQWFERMAEDESNLVWAVHDERGRHIGSAGLDRININR